MTAYFKELTLTGSYAAVSSDGRIFSGVLQADKDNTANVTLKDGDGDETNWDPGEYYNVIGVNLRRSKPRATARF
jgi:hypothetical protein